jgi:hypothetical protein
LLIYLLSKPDNWKVILGDVQHNGDIGRDKARRLLKELERAGYIKKEDQTINPDGTFGIVLYRIYETKQQPCTENPSTDEASTENPTLHNTDTTEDRYKEKDSTPCGVGSPKADIAITCVDCGRTETISYVAGFRDETIEDNGWDCDGTMLCPACIEKRIETTMADIDAALYGESVIEEQDLIPADAGQHDSTPFPASILVAPEDTPPLPDAVREKFEAIAAEHEKPKSDKDVNKGVNELIDVWLTEQSIIDSGAYRKTGYRSTCKDLYLQGITPDDLRGFIQARKKEPFWQDIAISWNHIRQNIATWKAKSTTTPAKSTHDDGLPPYVPDGGYVIG